MPHVLLFGFIGGMLGGMTASSTSYTLEHTKGRALAAQHGIEVG